MSLVCHTIISENNPEIEETIEQEVEIDQESWRIGAALAPAQRRHVRPPPSFVPATLEYDEYGMPKLKSKQAVTTATTPSEGVRSWYRSLTGRAREKFPERGTSLPSSTPTPAPVDVETQETPLAVQERLKTRPNWFTVRPKQEGPRTKSTTLSDLLARNPPPRPDERPFTPPVFLHLGPSNKGFNMLLKKGWQEGEGLGCGRIEHKGEQGVGINRSKSEGASTKVKVLADSEEPTVKQEVVDLTLSDTEERQTSNVIDLTASDTEEEEDIPDEEMVEMEPMDASEHHGKTLITPLATTLKADRLGIGLKAKRRKAITHTSASIAAHIRTSNQARKEFKARFGRGSRGFTRAKQKESRDRVNMLAYLNS